VPPGAGGGADKFGLGGAALKFIRAARKHLCKPVPHNAVRVCLLAVCWLAGIAPAWSQAGGTNPAGAASAPGQTAAVIDRIEFEGNRLIRAETLTARIFTRVGGPYREEGLRRDFQALWNTQFFEDIRLEVQNDPNRPNGKIVIFHVVERPTIRKIEYRGNKSITESDILDAFKMAKVGLAVESRFDPTKITKAKIVLEEMEAAHGHQFAMVRPTYERIPSTNAIRLIFTIVEGPKVKVGLITFTGNHVFSNRKLIRSMKKTRPYSIPAWLFEIPVMPRTFDQAKLDEDTEEGVRATYQNAGYFKVVVHEPVLKTVDLHKPGVPVPIPLIGRERGKATNISIAIDEGEQYRMGRLVIRSADPDKGLSLKRDYLEGVFPVKKGDIFDLDKVRKAIENYTKLYGVYGYVDFTATPSFDLHEDTKTIDLTFDFDEQKQYFVRRIEFSGNVGTRDKVIRRELLLNEGDIFNNRYWELSLLRLNQLNYFDPIKPENAEIKRNQQAGTVDILLKLKEKGKQSISLTGGDSGLSGAFLGLSYQTNNFLGLGETLTLSGQIGQFQRSVLFGFTEPYLFDRPISTGFTISSSRFVFNQSEQTSLLLGQKIQIAPSIEQDYNQNSTGITVFASYPLRKFSFTRLGVTYGYTDTSIQSFSQSSTDLFQVLQFQSLAGPSALSGIHQSQISPTLTYNTVDNPINPTKGKSFYYALGFAGLGGNVRALTNTFQAKYFRPINRKRNTLAFNFVGSFATGFGGRELPPFERLYLGGETDLRGFDVRTVTPISFIPVASAQSVSFADPTHLDGFGNPTVRTVSMPFLTYQISFPGGDTSGVFNAEYRIPIVGPVSMSLFSDAGTVGTARQSQLALNSVGLSALTTQFPGVPISNSLGLDPGTNFKFRGSVGIEFVVHLPIINAPFRLFWSYNYDRLSQQIVAPSGSFNGTCPTGTVISNCVTLNNLVDEYGTTFVNSVIQPQLNSFLANPERINFFEQKTTLRFTVSRTF
jgi:outer membrane protein insertion porin family